MVEKRFLLKYLKSLKIKQKGLAFHIGSVVDQSNHISYRYGFGFLGKGFIYPIENLSNIDLTEESLTRSSRFSLTVFDKVLDVSVTKDLFNENVLQIKINGFEGRAVLTVDNEVKPLKVENFDQIYTPFNDKTKDLVLLLSDRKAENVLISGGKGSSLASLNYLNQKLQTLKSVNFEIPKGVVVTYNAYKLLIDQNRQISQSIDALKSHISKNDLLKKESANVVNTIRSAQLPQEIKDRIRLKLQLIYDENDLKNKLFAVRSSASGEDSEDMSAAGQMATYLGVKGFDAIYSSVIKCWSSQFEFGAIEYKRGYGQDINSLMAVVIQEMIDCDSAGVMFTCDPVTGDEREIIITGNYGIGESVVSAVAEPDTIRVAVNIKDNSFNCRTIGEIKSIVIGSKAKSIKIDGSGSGTVEVDTNNRDNCCINSENTIRLANIALEIQKFFGSVRDIEWGIKDNQIYILQSRPVTNLDSGFTEYELMHENDTGLPSECEYLSKANIGEVMPGCSSQMCFTYFFNIMLINMFKGAYNNKEAYNPYSMGNTAVYCSHSFINLKHSDFMNTSSNGNLLKALMLAILGYELDPQIINDCTESCKPEPLSVRIWRCFYCIPYMLAPDYYIKQYYNTIRRERFILDNKFESAQEMFEAIKRNPCSFLKKSIVHLRTSEASILYNFSLILILSEEQNNTNILTDFAYLLSQCGQLVSADVPHVLRQLAQSIEEPKLFKQMSDEKALKYLQNTNNKSSEHFRKFIENHGHRGYKEVDPLARMWKEDPIPIITSLKTLLSIEVTTYKTKDKNSISKIIDSLKTSLSFHRKLILKHILLPLTRRAVAKREETKSILVYGMDIGRQALRALADRMHSEGLIPDSDLLFHMTLEEVQQLFITRNPIIIAKAKHRKRLHQKMNDWKFDSIVKGFDFQAINLIDNDNSYTNLSDVVIKGTPVSVGRIVARVCVAPDLKDAQHLQAGDILVTYSTDIGWSPYFPIIGGIATEIGGLISHGAVIAREYGLPCLVGTIGACRAFKTGDLVLLDCQKGILTKVEDN